MKEAKVERRSRSPLMDHRSFPASGSQCGQGQHRFDGRGDMTSFIDHVEERSSN
jgi:hypothetical protein